MYTLLICIIYLAFISLGLPDSTLGAAWPVMYETLGVPISYMGIIAMLISGGTIISSLFSDKLTRKFGTNKVTANSVLLTAIALIGFSISNRFWMLLIFTIPYGLGAGAIDAALNNYVAIHYSSKHMSWLHSFWGVGTIISPFVMSYSLSNFSWSFGYRLIAFIQMGIGIVLFITLPIWKVNELKKEEVVEQKALSIKDVCKIKGVPSLLIAFLCYCATEGTTSAWACTYLVKCKEMDEIKASALGSIFFIGITAGRFIAGFISNKLGDRKMINLGTVGIFIGVIMLLIPTHSIYFSFAGFLMIGFGCAPIYPSIIHSTPNNFGAENSGAIIGIQMASAYLGSTFMPPLMGLLGDILGFEILPIYILGFVVLMTVMINKTFLITAKK